MIVLNVAVAVLLVVGPPGVGSNPALDVTTFVGAAFTNKHKFKFTLKEFSYF